MSADDVSADINDTAIQYVMRRLRDAGINPEHVTVRSRQSDNEAPSTRTTITLADGRDMPDRLGARILRITADLPAYDHGHHNADGVVAVWYPSGA